MRESREILIEALRHHASKGRFGNLNMGERVHCIGRGIIQALMSCQGLRKYAEQALSGELLSLWTWTKQDR